MKETEPRLEVTVTLKACLWFEDNDNFDGQVTEREGTWSEQGGSSIELGVRRKDRDAKRSTKRENPIMIYDRMNLSYRKKIMNPPGPYLTRNQAERHRLNKARGGEAHYGGRDSED